MHTVGRQIRSFIVVIAIIASMLVNPMTANADETDTAGYVLIGNTRVSRSLGVQTEEQLTERLRQGYVSVTFNQYAQPIEVEPLNNEQTIHSRPLTALETQRRSRANLMVRPAAIRAIAIITTPSTAVPVLPMPSFFLSCWTWPSATTPSGVLSPEP